MNEKKAKALRKHLKKNLGIKRLDACNASYTIVNEQGTIMLNECPRGVYRTLKKEIVKDDARNRSA